MKNLSILELVNSVNNNKIPSNSIYFVNILLLAINDWPLNVENLEDYCKQIEYVISGRITKINIESYLKSVDFTKNAWEAESLTQLLEIYKFDKQGATLQEIISTL